MSSSFFCAVGVRLALEPYQRALAGRAAEGEVPDRRPGPSSADGADDLGDDVAGLANDDALTRAHVLQDHLILVVQRGEGHRRPADDHRLEHGIGRGPAGATDRDFDVEQAGGLLLRGQLAGQRPAGRSRGRASSIAEPQVIELDDDAVDVIGKLVPPPLELVALLDDGLDADHRCHVGRDRQADGPQGLEHRRVRVEIEVASRHQALDPPELVAEESEGTGGRHGRILLAQRARSCVAGVRELLGTRSSLALVHLVEGLEREVDLAPHLEDLRQRSRSGAEALGNALDRRHVRRHVLAGDPVTAGGGLDEAAIEVGDRHRHTIDLRLHREAKLLDTVEIERSSEALGPGADALFLLHWVQARQQPPALAYAEQHVAEQAQQAQAGAEGAHQRLKAKCPPTRVARTWPGSS